MSSTCHQVTTTSATSSKRSRLARIPIAPVEVGHRSATLCHLGVIACRLGKQKTLRWDPQTERFTNDDDANAMLRRPWRSPWNI